MRGKSTTTNDRYRYWVVRVRPAAYLNPDEEETTDLNEACWFLTLGTCHRFIARVGRGEPVLIEDAEPPRVVDVVTYQGIGDV